MLSRKTRITRTCSSVLMVLGSCLFVFVGFKRMCFFPSSDSSPKRWWAFVAWMVHVSSQANQYYLQIGNSVRVATSSLDWLCRCVFRKRKELKPRSSWLGGDFKHHPCSHWQFGPGLGKPLTFKSWSNDRWSHVACFRCSKNGFKIRRKNNKNAEKEKKKKKLDPVKKE